VFICGAWQGDGPNLPGVQLAALGRLDTPGKQAMRIPLCLPLILLLAAGCAGTPATSGPTSAGQASDRQADRAVEVALSMLGKPYRYGGSTPKGFDCSGLVNYSFGQAGIRVSRETRTLRQQATLVRASGLRRGDLVFFDQEDKKYSHVGIYLGDGRFVHAPSSGGKVRTDSLEADYWRRHFVEARRI
jgi:cell wall-associated NlpC family hydrolase